MRSLMILVMYLVGLEHSELSALEQEKLPYTSDCLHSIICKCRTISTKLGHNIYGHKISSDEFDYRSNPTSTTDFFALEFGKIAEFDFVYSLKAQNLVNMYMTIISWMSSIMDLIGPEQS